PLPAAIGFVEFQIRTIRLHPPLVEIKLDDRINPFPADAGHNSPPRAINSHPRSLAIPMPDAADPITPPMLKSSGQRDDRTSHQQNSLQPLEHVTLRAATGGACCPNHPFLFLPCPWALAASPSPSFQSPPA